MKKIFGAFLAATLITLSNNAFAKTPKHTADDPAPEEKEIPAQHCYLVLTEAQSTTSGGNEIQSVQGVLNPIIDSRGRIMTHTVSWTIGGSEQSEVCMAQQGWWPALKISVYFKDRHEYSDGFALWPQEDGTVIAYGLPNYLSFRLVPIEKE